jgi:hypothetical protein
MGRSINRQTRKTQCEECIVLDARTLLRRTALGGGYNRAATITWTVPNSLGLGGASAHLEISDANASPVLRVRYSLDRFTAWPRADDSAEFDRTIFTCATRQRPGGLRHWLLCPECRRRCCLLYFHQCATGFACCHCHGLIHRSAQERKTKAEARRKAMEASLEAHLAQFLGTQSTVESAGKAGRKAKP